MRLFVFFVAAGLFAQTNLFHPRVTAVPANWERGTKRALRLLPIWIEAYAITAAAADGTITVPGLPNAPSGTAYRFMAGPGGVLPAEVSTDQTYERVPINTESFQVKQEFAGPGWVVPFPGYTLTPPIYFGRRASLTNSHTTIWRLDLPAGFSVVDAWTHTAAACIVTSSHGGGYQLSGDSSTQCNVRIAMDASVPLGLTTIPVVITKLSNGGGYTDGQIITTLNVTFNVIEPDAEVLAASPASFRAFDAATIANVRTLLQNQGNLSGAARKPCNESTGLIDDPNPESASPVALSTAGTAGEQQVWFYDGVVWLRSAAQLVGKPAYDQCAAHLAQFYGDEVIANSGNLNASGIHRRFSEGHLRALTLPGMAYLKRANFAHAIFPNAPIHRRGEPATGEFSRQRALSILNTINAAEACGVTRLDRMKLMTNGCGVDWPAVALGLERNIDSAIQDLKNRADGVSDEYQTFFGGLVAYALGRYYEFSYDTWPGASGTRRDPRVLAALVKYADWVWSDVWRGSAGQYSNPFPIGPRCAHSCQSEGKALVHLATTPLMAFLYYYTGLPRFEDRAHEALQHGTNLVNNKSGKQRSQEMSYLGAAIAFMRGHGRYLAPGYVLP